MFQRILITLSCLFVTACLAEAEHESTQSAALTDEIGDGAEPTGDVPTIVVTYDSFEYEDPFDDHFGDLDIPELQLEKAGCRRIEVCSGSGTISRAGVEFSTLTCKNCMQCCLPNPWGGETCTRTDCTAPRQVIR